MMSQAGGAEWEDGGGGGGGPVEGGGRGKVNEQMSGVERGRGGEGMGVGGEDWTPYAVLTAAWLRCCNPLSSREGVG